MKPELKKCSRCGEEKPFDDFYAMRGTKDGKRPSCKACGKAHPEKSREACRRWRERNKEYAQQLSRKWEQEHPERKKELRKQWGKQNPDKVRFNAIKHTAKVRNMPFEIDFLEWLERFWQQPCVYCEGESNGGVDRLDNNIGYTSANCVPCCFLCNTIKRNLELSQLSAHLSKMLEGIGRLVEHTDLSEP